MQLTTTTFEFTVNLQFILTASRLNPLHQGKSPNLKKVLEPENSKTSGCISLAEQLCQQKQANNRLFESGSLRLVRRNISLTSGTILPIWLGKSTTKTSSFPWHIFHHNPFTHIFFFSSHSYNFNLLSCTFLDIFHTFVVHFVSYSVQFLLTPTMPTHYISELHLIWIRTNVLVENMT